MTKSSLQLHKWHNLEMLSAICNTPIEDWRTRDFGAILRGFDIGNVTVVDSPPGARWEQWYIYIDNGADVLGVAHLDSVQNHVAGNHFLNAGLLNIGTDLQKTHIYNPFLDDRLGVYTLLHTLPFIFRERSGGFVEDDKQLIKLPYDILLTIDEESGRSSAKMFEPPEGKKYNWMFEFDAGGSSDVKCYQYLGNTEWTDALQSAGYLPEYGTFTDIADLDGLGCSGVNISCGYYQYHQRSAYFIVEEYDLAFARFLKFWGEHKDTHFEFIEAYNKRSLGYYNYQDYDDYSDYYRPYSSRKHGNKTITSYTPKGKRSITSSQKRDWSWLTHGAENVDYNSWTETKTLSNNTTLKIDNYYYLGKDIPEGFTGDYIIAAYCSDCKKPHLADELTVERGRALCMTCLGTSDMEAINLTSDWLEEGGAIQFIDGVHKRIISGFDERKYSSCPLCGQPEWVENIRPFTIRGIDENGVHMCRWCATEWSAYLIETDDLEEEPSEPSNTQIMVVNKSSDVMNIPYTETSTRFSADVEDEEQDEDPDDWNIQSAIKRVVKGFNKPEEDDTDE